MPNTIQIVYAVKRAIEQKQVCRVVITHPMHTTPLNIKARLLYQIIASVKGEVRISAHKHAPHIISLQATPDEQRQIQAMANYFIPLFWTEVNHLYYDFVDRHEELQVRETA